VLDREPHACRVETEFARDELRQHLDSQILHFARVADDDFGVEAAPVSRADVLALYRAAVGWARDLPEHGTGHA